MKIREATPADGPAIAHVQVTSWRETYAGIVPQDHLDAMSETERAPQWAERVAAEQAVILVAEDTDGVFGFAAGGAIMHPVEGYDGELGAIYLLQSHHGKGTGRALVRQMAQKLRDRGFSNMVVWVLKENPGCGFYRRLGGRQVGEKTVEIGGESLPEIAFGWPQIDALCQDATAKS